MLDRVDSTSLVLRHTAVVRRIAREHRVRRATAGRWLVECIRFLDLCAASATPLAPSKKVDRAWHELILHTRAYAELCEERYGRFIHHDPAESADPDAYRRTLIAYTAAYGAPDRRIWPAKLPGGGSGGSCGGDGAGCGGGGCGGGGG